MAAQKAQEEEKAEKKKSGERKRDILANASTSSRLTEIRQTLDDENLSSEVDRNIGSKISEIMREGTIT